MKCSEFQHLCELHLTTNPFLQFSFTVSAQAKAYHEFELASWCENISQSTVIAVAVALVTTDKLAVLQL